MCGNLAERIPDKSIVTDWLTGWMGYRRWSKIKWQFILDLSKKYSRNRLSDPVSNTLTSSHHGETEIPFSTLRWCFVKAEEAWSVQVWWSQPSTWRLVTQFPEISVLGYYLAVVWGSAACSLKFCSWEWVLWWSKMQPSVSCPMTCFVIKDASDYQSNPLTLLFVVIGCYKEGESFLFSHFLPEEWGS